MVLCMTTPPVQSDFSVSGAERVQIHQMWICMVRSDGGCSGIASSIPLQYVDRAIANANRYPQADFTVWYDGVVTDDLSRFWLGSLICADARHGNVRVRDLRDIPAYAAEPLFDARAVTDGRRDAGSVYLRADFARVMLLAYLARQGRHRFAVYADMDCADVCVPEITDVMRAHGVVLNALSSAHAFRVSNGVIGLDLARPDMSAQLDRLVADTRTDIAEKSLADGAFVAFLTRLGGMDDAVFFKIQRALLPPVYADVPPNPLYRSLGIS